MKRTIVTTNRLELEPVKEPFEISFAWNKKRGVPSNNDHWFTPTGKCKMYIGALHTIPIGEVTQEVYDQLIKDLKKAKTDLFTDGRDYYTTISNNNIAEVRNASSILYRARQEYEARKQEFEIY